MWFFKKKVKVKPKATKKVIKYVNEQVDVGRTEVDLKLKDGRKFKTFVYGVLWQHVDSNDGPYSKIGAGPIVGEKNVFDSCHQAKEFIKTIGNEQTYVDNPQNPSKSVFGKAISAKVGYTHSHFMTFPVAYLVKEL